MPIRDLLIVPLLVNIILLVLFSILRNAIVRKSSVQSLIVFLLAGNVIFATVGVLIGFSSSEFLTGVYQAFNQGVGGWYIYGLPMIVLAIIFIGLAISSDLKQLITKQHRIYWLVIGFYLLVVLLIWLPYGFDYVGDHEIWAMKDYLTFGESTDRLKVEVVSRLSAIITRAIGQLISPDGFGGMNLVYMLLFVSKGILLFGILKRFRFPNGLNFVISLLFMIYPGYPIMMSLRNYAPLSALSCSLLATYLFLSYVQNHKRLHLIAFYIAMFLAVTTVEYAYLYIVLFPLALLFFEKKFTERWLNLSVIWYLIPVWHLAYYVLVLQYVPTHLGERYYGAYTSLPQEALLTLETVGRSLGNLLGINWLLTLAQPPSLQSIITSVITVLLFLLIYNRLKQNEQVSKRKLLSYMLVGILLLIIGALFFGLIPNRRFSDWRIHTFASIGAAMFIITAIQLIFMRWNPRWQTILYGLVIFLAMQLVLQNQARYYESVVGRTNFLQSIQKQVEEADPDAVWVLLTDLDEVQLTETWGIFRRWQYGRATAVDLALGVAGNMETYVCAPNVEALLCEVDASMFVIQNRDGDFTIDGTIVIPEDGLPIPYDKIVFWQLQSDGSTQLLQDFPSAELGVDFTVETYDPLAKLTLKG